MLKMNNFIESLLRKGVFQE